VRDATGPAEISEPKTASGIAGASSSVLVRYPVRTHSLGQRIIAQGALLDRMERTETGIRCVTVSAHHSIETGGATKFSISRPREDGSSCGEGRTFSAYPELERAAGRLKDCQARGEDRCLLSTTIPEAKARELMNRR
jgi:hypothetical protein